jgi:hypothetical protein
VRSPDDLLEVELVDIKARKLRLDGSIAGLWLLRDLFPEPYLCALEIPWSYAVSPELHRVRTPKGVVPFARLRGTAGLRGLNSVSKSDHPGIAGSYVKDAFTGCASVGPLRSAILIASSSHGKHSYLQFGESANYANTLAWLSDVSFDCFMNANLAPFSFSPASCCERLHACQK